MLRPLKGFDSVGRVYKSGRKFSERACLASFSGKGYEAGDDNLVLHYCVSVGKRTAKKAVIRNRIKRLLRLSLRRVLPALLTPGTRVPFDSLVLSWKVAPAHPMLIRETDVEPVVRRLLERALNPGKNNRRED